MNERIETYLKQHHYPDYYNNYGFLIKDDHYFMYREDVNGLIELIVRECGVVLNPMLRDMVSRGHAFNLIKEHFGVEE